MGHRLRPKILDMNGSLQRQSAGEPYTPYRIWPHHSWLKRRGHQTIKLNSGVIHTTSFPHYDIRGQAGFHHLPARSTSFPGPGQAPVSIHFARGLSTPGRLHWCQGLRERRYLVPSTTGRGHRHPWAHDSRCLSAGIHPIAVWYGYSTKETHIIAMIALTMDKHTLDGQHHIKYPVPGPLHCPLKRDGMG
jgi:hypothetical protein